MENERLGKMAQTSKSALLTAIKIACGILALALFRWTPATGKGIAFFLVLFLVLIGLGIILSGDRSKGFWPKRPEE
jgi:hypothetical protein